MVALKIEDIKGFTKKLFIGDVFDIFLLREATIVTFNTFSIDGHIRQGYYTEQELEENKIEEFSAWKAIRPICFTLIKGKKLPGSFQITLQLPPDAVERFLTGAGLDYRTDQVGGLYLNIRYEEGILHCVTGTSLKIFTLDKQLEIEWDEAVKRFLKKNLIPFIEM